MLTLRSCRIATRGVYREASRPRSASATLNFEASRNRSAVRGWCRPPMNQWEYLYYQHRNGSIPAEYWVGAEDYYRNLVAAKPGYHRFWSGNQSSFD